MPATVPVITFLHASPEGPKPFRPEELEAHLPTGRPGTAESASVGVTYREYLAATRAFVRANLRRISELSGREGNPAVIDSVDIVSEKHGSDYHPSRVLVHTPAGSRSFVLNVALTERGENRLEREFHLLQRLGGQCAAARIPRVYILDKVRLPVGEREGASMFLGEWFEGYHEFHISVDPETDRSRVVLWDTDHGPQWLSSEEEVEVFRQASSILTEFYNVRTMEEIFPWHHAAGDFVVRRTSDGIDVRLITVRQYAARIGFHGGAGAEPVLALALFLANLTVRMRLDRLDGVGDIAWAGETSVHGALSGFLDALRAKAAQSGEDRGVIDEFVGFVGGVPLEGLAELFGMVLEAYDPASPDWVVVKEHLPDHVFQVYQGLERLFI